MCQLLRKNLIFLVIFILIFSWANFAFSSGVVESTVKISVCGNNIKEANEVCDGTDLADKTCQDFNYTHGNLACSLTCDEFDTTACYTPPASPPSGGGGGGGAVPTETKVIFSGRAYPGSAVTLLKDAQIAVKTIAGPDSNFEISLAGLSGGNYIFSIYGEDKNGLKSPLFTFSISITSGVTTKVSGIFLAPTIAVDKSEVRRGDNIAIFGQSTAASEISISVSSEEEVFVKTKTDKDGVYLYNFDTSPFEIAQHFMKSKAALDGEISSFSKVISFIVGTKNVFAQLPTKCPAKADLNGDCKVNLVDFSIAAYWYKRPLSAAFKSTEIEKLNGDGKIDLIDFSIMAYYWTG